MSEKTSHIHLTEPMVSNIHFSPEFSSKREAWRQLRGGGWKIPDASKKALNDSIVVLAGAQNNGNVVINTPEVPKLPENDADGTYVWDR